MWTHVMTTDVSVGVCRGHVWGTMLTSQAFNIVMAMLYLLICQMLADKNKINI